MAEKAVANVVMGGGGNNDGVVVSSELGGER